MVCARGAGSRGQAGPQRAGSTGEAGARAAQLPQPAAARRLGLGRGRGSVPGTQLALVGAAERGRVRRRLRWGGSPVRDPSAVRCQEEGGGAEGPLLGSTPPGGGSPG